MGFRLKIQLATLQLVFICLILSCKNGIQEYKIEQAPSLEKFGDGLHHWRLFHESKYQRYSPENYEAIALNLLAYQNQDGGWPKNIDWLGIVNTDSLKNTLSEKDLRSTIDNNNVFPQIEYLSKVFVITGQEKFKTGALKGIRYLLKNQHSTGGWRGADVDAITFNDQVMTGVMNLFLDIQQQPLHYRWIGNDLSDSIQNSLKKAIQVTLACQIDVNGVKTAWCQQHDHITFKPVKARSYELPSITARESTDVIQFLMRIESPSQKIIEAINSAIAWLENAKIYNIRLERIPLDKIQIINKEYPYDLIVVHDPSAKPIWARYYNLKTNEPFLCRRDGTIVYSLKEVDPERRTGYAWYGYWPEPILEKEYPEWLKINGLK